MKSTSQSSPSTRLADWITQQIETAQPGDAFPTDTELAKRFSVSVPTVRRVFCLFRDRGLVSRIRGKGTFIPSASTTLPELDRASSTESIANLIRERIATGNYQAGEFLPQIKFFALDFRVGHKTVRDACRILEHEQLITRVGRNYIVGDGSACCTTAGTREIHIFTPQHHLGFLFHASRLSQTYHAMELELIKHGYSPVYHTEEDLFMLLGRWEREKNYPFALAFLNYNRSLLDPMRDKLKAFLYRADKRRPSVVITTKAYRGLIPRLRYFNEFESNRSLARVLLDFALRVRYERIVFCAASSEPNHTFSLRALNTMRRELERVSSLSRALVTVDEESGSDSNPLLRDLRSEHLSARTLRFLQTFDIEWDRGGLHGDIPCYKTPDGAISSARPGDLWVCKTDIVAETMVGLLGDSCPERIGVVSLENNPAYYRKRISACVLDHQKAGYSLAHAILGDLPVATNSKRFIKTNAYVLPRDTTR